MIGDLWTVMTKEWREYFASGGSRRGGLIGILLVVGIFGVFLPFQAGLGWVRSPFTVFFYGSYLPLSLVANVIADAFAGERERHTLETLLASRLSDRAILFGKIGAAVGYSWALSVLTALVGMIVANLRDWSGSLHLYSAGIAGGILALAFLVSLLYAGIGVLVSLRATTVRQAQQALGIGSLVVFIVPFLVFSSLPNGARAQLIRWLASANVLQVGILVAAVLLTVDLILVAIAVARFQRSRLILS